MENVEIAKLLAETADLMEIAASDPFRIRSYRNAARPLSKAIPTGSMRSPATRSRSSPIFRGSGRGSQR